MSVFHKTMVWLGLVDDEEYYGDDEYYVDEYGDPVAAPARQPSRATATVAAPAPPESSPLTVIRSRRERDGIIVQPPKRRAAVKGGVSRRVARVP